MHRGALALVGCLDSLERGTVEWNSGTVDWWNSGMVECADDDPVPTFPTYCACAAMTRQTKKNL